MKKATVSDFSLCLLQLPVSHAKNNVQPKNGRITFNSEYQNIRKTTINKLINYVHKKIIKKKPTWQLAGSVHCWFVLECILLFFLAISLVKCNIFSKFKGIVMWLKRLSMIGYFFAKCHNSFITLGKPYCSDTKQFINICWML